jgi:N-acetylated-alpha-linked acidic dipeptidase
MYRLRPLAKPPAEARSALTTSHGLPGRPWVKRQVRAPGFHAGYGVKTLPAVREALELRRWDEAEQQVVAAARTLEGYAARLDEAATLARH